MDGRVGIPGTVGGFVRGIWGVLGVALLTLRVLRVRVFFSLV